MQTIITFILTKILKKNAGKYIVFEAMGFLSVAHFYRIYDKYYNNTYGSLIILSKFFQHNGH